MGEPAVEVGGGGFAVDHAEGRVEGQAIVQVQLQQQVLDRSPVRFPDQVADHCVGLPIGVRCQVGWHPGEVTAEVVVVEGRSGGYIKSRLGERGINVAMSPRNFTLLDMEDRGLEEVVRASVHYYNSEEEIDRFVEALCELLVTR